MSASNGLTKSEFLLFLAIGAQLKSQPAGPVGTAILFSWTIALLVWNIIERQKLEQRLSEANQPSLMKAGFGWMLLAVLASILLFSGMAAIDKLTAQLL